MNGDFYYYKMACIFAKVTFITIAAPIRTMSDKPLSQAYCGT